MTWGALADSVSRAAAPAVVPPPESDSSRGAFAVDLGAEGSLLRILTNGQAATVTRYLGMTVPALRKGHAVITKQPATWALRAWRGEGLAQQQPAWLANPDPRCTRFDLVAATMDDAIWHDRAHWRVTRRGADGFPLTFAHVPAVDVSPDGIGGWLVNGKTPREAFPEDPGPVVFTDGRILESFLTFHWHGMGGLRGAGSVVVDLALALLNAATNYANAPVPSTTLVNDSGTQLTDTEVEALLTTWETKRAARATAFLQGVKAEHNGFSARDLQLVEAREHSALEVARALALPAFAVDAANGASLQYSTTVENRRDLVEALRLWIAPVEQGLTLHATPRGIEVSFDVTSYVRDDASTRMQTWAAGIASGVLTVEEARAAEPLATGGKPA